MIFADLTTPHCGHQCRSEVNFRGANLVFCKIAKERFSFVCFSLFPFSRPIHKYHYHRVSLLLLVHIYLYEYLTYSLPAMAPALLLAHATVLVPDLSPAATADGGVVARRDCDVLVRGSKIEAVGSGLVNGYGTAARDGQQVEIEVVDCRGKIVSPGFVDTHHHLWQTQLKGRTADRTLAEYFCCCYWHNAHYTPEDVFWGTLAGCLEAIDTGTTTVVDHAHCAISREHGIFTPLAPFF